MKKTILLSLIAAPFIIVGCGGGSSSTASTATSAKISGTVPGTLIEAFCADGSYAQVTSVNNGTTQHPFEISVPLNVECRLVMTTNENDPINRVITPIGFANGTTTGTTITLNANIDLGHIALSTNPATVNTVAQVVINPLVVDINGTTVGNNPIQDNNGNGMLDAYDDDDNDDISNAYEDDDHDGIENIHDDDDHDGRPDHLDDDDNDGRNNSNDNDSSNDNDNDHNGNDNDSSNDNDNDHNENDNDSNNDSDNDHNENDNDQN